MRWDSLDGHDAGETRKRLDERIGDRLMLIGDAGPPGLYVSTVNCRPHAGLLRGVDFGITPTMFADEPNLNWIIYAAINGTIQRLAIEAVL